MQEKNLVELFLDAGFERYVSDIEKRKGRYADFNPKNGWMGVVTYHPYERFEKGDKALELSLERFGVKSTLVYDGKVETKSLFEKQIKLYVNREVVYINDYGVLPPQEVINKFIN